MQTNIIAICFSYVQKILIFIFILCLFRDRCSPKDKWYSFNDAEVKSFDPNQIAGECFGGEVNSRTYDQVTDKFLDLSIEKTNSAYMLFYERVNRGPVGEAGPSSEASGSPGKGPSLAREVRLSPDLEEWIWADNRNFIQDNNIFDHTYFNFMWQMVQFLPTTLSKEADGAADDITLMSAKLATAFFLETFIHAKEKLNIVQWVEVLTKQLDSSGPACRLVVLSLKQGPMKYFLFQMDPRPHGLRLPLAGDDLPPVQHRHNPPDVPQTCHPRHTGTTTIDINHQAVQSG